MGISFSLEVMELIGPHYEECGGTAPFRQCVHAILNEKLTPFERVSNVIEVRNFDRLRDEQVRVGIIQALFLANIGDAHEMLNILTKRLSPLEEPWLRTASYPEITVGILKAAEALSYDFVSPVAERLTFFNATAPLALGTLFKEIAGSSVLRDKTTWSSWLLGQLTQHLREYLKKGVAQGILHNLKGTEIKSGAPGVMSEVTHALFGALTGSQQIEVLCGHVSA